jgi:hypothetical protein
MTRFHPGEGYTDTQQEALDLAYSQWLEASQQAENARWSNGRLNREAEQAWSRYEGLKWKFDLYGDDDPRQFSTYYNEER